jgi:hypothetical protein
MRPSSGCGPPRSPSEKAGPVHHRAFDSPHRRVPCVTGGARYREGGRREEDPTLPPQPAVRSNRTASQLEHCPHSIPAHAKARRVATCAQGVAKRWLDQRVLPRIRRPYAIEGLSERARGPSSRGAKTDDRDHVRRGVRGAVSSLADRRCAGRSWLACLAHSEPEDGESSSPYAIPEGQKGPTALPRVQAAGRTVPASFHSSWRHLARRRRRRFAVCRLRSRRSYATSILISFGFTASTLGSRTVTIAVACAHFSVSTEFAPWNIRSKPRAPRRPRACCGLRTGGTERARPPSLPWSPMPATAGSGP